MIFEGVLSAINRNFRNGRINVTFELTEGSMTELEGLYDVPLSIEVKKFFKKRSGKQNNLFWYCLEGLRKSQNPPLTKEEIYFKELKEWGVSEHVWMIAKAFDQFKQQWKTAEVVREYEHEGEKWVEIIAYYGTSTYNTQQFTHLMNGILRDMEELGIERPTSSEMRRFIEQWEKNPS